MKRRLVKQGNQSFTITLPVNWIRERGLQEKDDLEVVPSGDFLILGNRAAAKKRRISLHLTENYGPSIKKLLASLYRNGYDEVTLTVDYEGDGSLHQFIWEELVGYEIIQRDTRCYVLRDIADLDPESFDVLFKECFLSLLNFKNEILQAINEQNREKLLQAVHHDVEINKLTNLCQRLLNKKMNDRRKIAILAAVLRGIEYIGDELKGLANFFAHQKAAPSPAAQEALTAVGQYLNETYFLYYNFNLNTLLKLHQKLSVLKDNLEIAPPRGEMSIFLNPILKKMKLLLEGPLVLKMNPDDQLKKEDWVC